MRLPRPLDGESIEMAERDRSPIGNSIQNDFARQHPLEKLLELDQRFCDLSERITTDPRLGAIWFCDRDVRTFGRSRFWKGFPKAHFEVASLLFVPLERRGNAHDDWFIGCFVCLWSTCV